MLQVELSAAEIAIEPGGTAQLTITLHNKQDHDDYVSLAIEGIDVEWYALPVPALAIPAGSSQSATALFKVTRSSDSLASTYPFIVRARSMETGEAAFQQATFVIKPYSALQVDVNPKRAVASFFQPINVFDISIANLGNREEHLTVSASDPDNECAYEFETDRVSLKPGHSKTVPLTIEPMSRSVLGSTHLVGFSVTARSTEDSYVSGNAAGQLERRALLSTASAAVILTFFLLAIGWALFRPRPVMILSFSASPMQVTAGETVKLSWRVDNLGQGSHIAPDNIPVSESVGTKDVSPTQTTTYKLVARGGGKEATQDVVVVVAPRPASPKPRIAEFKASQLRIHQGDAVTLTWTVDNADKIFLNPLNMEREARLFTSQEHRPDQTTTYTLVAKGQGGDVEQKSIKVEVVPANVSIAKIVYFKAKPETVERGKKTTLNWSVENAIAIEIDNGVGINLKPKDKIEVAPTANITYKLTAVDNKGNQTVQELKVTVTEPPVSDGTAPTTTQPPSGPPP